MPSLTGGGVATQTASRRRRARGHIWAFLAGLCGVPVPLRWAEPQARVIETKENVKDAARNLHASWGIFEYVAVPVAMVAVWVAFYCMQLKTRPLVPVNDPHLAEILEPEHATA